MDEIVAELLANTGALGVWLVGAMLVADNQHQNEVLAGAAHDPSIKRPTKLMVEGETYFDFVEWRSRSAKRHSSSCLMAGRRSD